MPQIGFSKNVETTEEDQTRARRRREHLVTARLALVSASDEMGKEVNEVMDDDDTEIYMSLLKMRKHITKEIDKLPKPPAND